MNAINSALGVDEMKNWRVLIKQLFAEFMASFLYLTLSPLVTTDKSNSNITQAFANGLLVASLVQIVGNVSGGHLNPAVTVGLAVCRHIKPLRALWYIIVQILGGILGALTAFALSEPTTRGDLGAFDDYTLRSDQVFGFELIMTFLHVSVVTSVADPTRGARGLGSAALAIGLSVTACQCAGVTAGALNPVRCFGPAIVMNTWASHWAYWLGPLLGGLIAGVVYRFLLNYNFMQPNM